MKCSESTTILCTCSATRQNARMQQVRANIIGADNTIMLSLAISRRHDLEIQLPDLLLDDFDTIAIERIKLLAWPRFEYYRPYIAPLASSMNKIFRETL